MLLHRDSKLDAHVKTRFSIAIKETVLKEVLHETFYWKYAYKSNITYLRNNASFDCSFTKVRVLQS